MNNKKGFTLVELLAIIVILAVISTVTYNLLSNNIKSTKKKSFEITAMNLLDASRQYVTKYMENYDFPEGGLSVTDSKLDIDNDIFISGIIIRNNEDKIELKNVSDGNYCANGTKEDLKITEGNCSIEDDDTKPVVNLKVLKRKSTRINLLLKMLDSESGIDYYEIYYKEKDKDKETEYGKFNMNKELIQLKQTIVIDELNSEKTYVIRIVVTNGVGIEKEITKEVTTLQVDEPQFSISSGTFATNKELTITYPENNGLYDYFYKINEESPIKLNGGNKTSFVIDKKISVYAYIVKKGDINSTLLSSNTILIDGLDNEEPIVNLTIPEINTWTQSKEFKVVASDIGADLKPGVGLALRPYTYDNGKEWIKDDSPVIESSMDLYIKARDRLGNISKKFTLNDSTICYTDGSKPPCKIDKIDSLGADINIEIISGEKIGNYYISDVELRITIINYYLYNNIKTVGGSAFKMDSLQITKNGSIIDKKIISETENELIYEVTLVENTAVNDVVNVEIEDVVKNSSAKSITVNIDRKTPDIKIIKNPLGLKSGINYLLTNNVSVKYGPLSGNLICNPENNKPFGSNNFNVECIATGNNRLVSKAKFTVKHEYPATKETNNVCHGTWGNCCGEFDPDTGGNTYACSCSSNGESSRFSSPSSGDCDCSNVTTYKCPLGGSPSNGICYY